MSRRAPVTPDHHRHWDSMSLAGLLAAVAEDPQLRTALDFQSDLLGITGGGERDLVAPSALRPVLSAALGALAYVGGPGRGTLLEYGGTRAVGLFKDPNVFGAFLVPAALIVVDADRPVGIVHFHDLLRAGVA